MGKELPQEEETSKEKFIPAGEANVYFITFQHFGELPRCSSNGKESAHKAGRDIGGDMGQIPGSGRSPGVGDGNLLQYLSENHGQSEHGGPQSTQVTESDTAECTHTHFTL